MQRPDHNINDDKTSGKVIVGTRSSDVDEPLEAGARHYEHFEEPLFFLIIITTTTPGSSSSGDDEDDDDDEDAR